MLILLLTLQVIILVIVFYGTNFRDRSWQVPIVGRSLHWLIKYK